mmetsp:Transcript_930/g.2212  ORF Transcript_930/g.2212 Transcript_930/m.2212 type:complete len:211 (+) Transcript_930:1460-2092(+)
MEHGKEETARLARSSLCHADQILAFDCQRPCLRLDGGGTRETGALEARIDGSRERRIFEQHVRGGKVRDRPVGTMALQRDVILLAPSQRGHFLDFVIRGLHLLVGVHGSGAPSSGPALRRRIVPVLGIRSQTLRLSLVLIGLERFGLTLLVLLAPLLQLFVRYPELLGLLFERRLLLPLVAALFCHDACMYYVCLRVSPDAAMAWCLVVR